MKEQNMHPTKKPTFEENYVLTDGCYKRKVEIPSKPDEKVVDSIPFIQLISLAADKENA